MTKEPRENPGYERSDAAPQPLMIFTLGLVVLIVASFFVSSWLTAAFGADSARDETHPMSEFRNPPQGPLLEPTTTGLIDRQRRRMEALLEPKEPEWIDRGEKIVRIPIDEAMRLTAERGLPTGLVPASTAPPEQTDSTNEEGSND